MATSERRSKRLQGTTAAAPNQETRKSARQATKRKAPPEFTSSSEEEIPGPAAECVDSLPLTPLDPAKDPTPEETTSRKIKQPISTLVHPTLKSSWVINPHMDMSLIFDTVSPARQFKRGTVDDGSQDFPVLDTGDLDDITETDAPGSSWIQYMPGKYK